MVVFVDDFNLGIEVELGEDEFEEGVVPFEGVD